ncbi:hypothetical protein [Flaviflexus ciconiae]|uniref:hypothetical protein n=1 Tax=Flaviflexus ciconiae TaxID=2496867 RepID=UPI0013DEA0D5|nr:hypothetical protein [Flaviflexus ciconiae]
MTRIECAVATHGNLSMKLLTEQDGRALPVGEVLLSRPRESRSSTRIASSGQAS